MLVLFFLILFNSYNASISVLNDLADLVLKSPATLNGILTNPKESRCSFNPEAGSGESFPGDYAVKFGLVFASD